MTDIPEPERPERSSTEMTPFPARQLFILALCRICEPIAFMSIFPYIYFMVKSFQITEDERQIAMYAGMVTSAFAFAEFSAGVFWGRLSDKVGRKPILLTGMAGTGISMLAFGFAPSLPVALVARAMGGILNGNIGVLQTTVAEVVTVEAHQSRAFSIMPFVWCLGSIIGAGIGGMLADPVKNYSLIFDSHGLFGRFPYLLPNLVCTAIVGFSLIVGILFLEETHEDKKERRDVGLQVGRRILRCLKWPSASPSKVSYFEETLEFAAKEGKADYDNCASSPLLTPSQPEELVAKCRSLPSTKFSFRQSFTRQITLIIVSYGILAFHTIALEQLMPILFSSAESRAPPHLPFKFDGGFALPMKTIGFILSAQGVLQMIAQIFLFPAVNTRLGSLTTFRIVIMSYPFLYFLIPYLALVPKQLRYICIFILLVWKVTAQSLSYPSQAIMLANSAPSKKVLGTLNGVAASAASLARAIGPTLAGLIHATGLHYGYSGISWWSCALFATVGACVSLFMTEVRCTTGPSLESHDMLDEERMLLLNSNDDETISKEPSCHKSIIKDNSSGLR